MKSRNVIGGALVGALALGLWIGSFWKGPGMGGAGTESNEDVSLDSAHVNSDFKPSSLTSAETDQSVESYPTDLMTVVIYGDEYRLVVGDAPQSGTLITLNEIVARAKKMTGSPEGIRVRILKGKSAQEGARADLMAALSENGVKREEIQERAGFVD